MTAIELIINQFILEQGKLYTLPEIYHQIDKKIQSKRASIDEIEEIISTDAILTAKILKMANSSIYAFRAEISTLNRALTLIGINEIKNIILVESMSGNFSNASQCPSIKLEFFWRRSIYLALIAKRLAVKIKISNPDKLFVAAIMSRLGQLICCSTIPAEVTQIHESHIKAPNEAEFGIEKRILGFTYNQLSAKILSHWKLPEEIIHSLQHLHEPHIVADPTLQMENAILNVATIVSGLLEIDDLSSAIEDNNEYAKLYLAQIHPEIQASLDLTAENMDALLFEIELDALEILGIIFPNTSLIF